MKNLFLIFIGGGIGSVLRHTISTFLGRYWGYQFPIGILAVNIIGSLGMGILLGMMSLYWSASHEWRSFLLVGVLGGFTTFSSFAADAILLFKRGDWIMASAYIGGSVGLSLVALVAGMAVVRLILGHKGIF